ncbi:BapA/Bap/LapF family large adhesin [Acinetobacter sp. YH12154]|uniref:BapA/Bap/LapF family large adhesin n=1 Tax=unclassified Acinetobacter TaxID=196816 RepID=UPI0035A0053D
MVEVKDQDGKIIGTGTVDSSGNFDVELKDPLTNGETVDVTVTDKVGNESEPTEATAKDTTKPDAPKDVVVTDDGEHATGKGEPGTIVEVKDQDGKIIGTGTVDSSGNFDVELKDPLTNGETVDVTVTDKAGNESEPTEATAKDTTKPDAPNATLNADGTVVTGKTEPGAKVEVRDENGKLIGSGTANSLGEFEILVSPAVTDGETAKVTAKDAAGNTSDPTTVTGGKDTLKPASPDATLNEDGTVVTGKTEPGAKVEVRDENGKLIGSGTANSLGDFEIPVSPAVTDSETAQVTAKDAAGNTSDPTTVTGGKDTLKPASPDATLNADGTAVTGKTEPGAKVEVRDENGKLIGSGTANSLGDFEIPVSPAVTDGETAKVTAKDSAGNTSDPTTVTGGKDTTKPDAPKDVVITDDGEHVTGKGEPGTIVEVKDQDGKIIGTGTVDSSGNFDVELKDPLTNGETVDVTVTDKAGNESEPTEATAKDTTKPDAPNATLNADGTVVTGKTEPGAKVEVRDENGKLIGSGTANSLGEFEILVSPAVTDGETAKVTAKDAAGNTSDPTTVIGAKDTINPEISIEDTTLTQDSMPTFKGKTEVGTDVSVVIRDNNGKIVDQGDAKVIGDQWSYRADKTLIDGEYSVEAIATDAAGNTGRATDTSFTIDATAPIVTIDDFKEPNFTGTVNEDANLQVQVQDSNGKDIPGTTTVKDGAWTFTPDSPVAEADYTVTVTATDAAGNQQIETGTVNTTLPTVDIDDLFGTSNFAAAFSRVSTLSVPANVPQTNQTKPTFSGTSTKSVEVTVYLRDANNKVIDSGLAKLDTATGKWTYTPANELLEGYYVLEAVSKDAAGNISSPASKTFVIDITDPVIEIQNAVLTSDVTPDVKGKTEIGSTVTVTVKKPNGDVIETGTATVDAKGDWSYSVKANLTDGAYQVTANAKDKAGNISDDVNTQVTVDSTAPKATITIADNGDVKISFSEKVVGFDADDIQVSGGKLKDLAQQADGSWTAQVVANGNDGSAATVKLDIAAGGYSDAAGNAGQAATVSHSVASIDSTAPKATITIADNGDVKISFSEKVVGFDADDVQVTGGKLKDLAQQADGSWTAKVVANGNDGSAAIVKVDIAAGSYSDAAGNAGQAATASHSVASIDSTAPKATITISDNGDVKISFSEKVVGFDADDVQVTGGKLTDLAQQADGSWTAKVVANGNDGSAATVKLDIAAGSYSDTAGNAGQAATASHSVASVDNTAPTITIDDLIITNDQTPTVSGETEPGASVYVYIKDFAGVVKFEGQASVFADGAWTFTPPRNLDDGEYTAVAIATDKAGNTAEANDGFEIDTTPPTVDIDDFDFFAAPAVAPLATFAMRATTLSTPSIPQTNNNKQTFSGTSSKSTEVQINIYDAENNLLDSGLAKLDTATGKWTYTPSVALLEGLLTLEAISKDIAGNISAPSTKQFIVDTIPPLIDIHDVGVITDPSPSFSGKTEKGVTVTVNVKDQLGNVVETGQALVDAQGNWSYQAKSNLTNGLYHIEAIAKDAAGNSSQKATTSTTIDSTADVSIDVQANADGSATVTGKTEPGASVEITTPDGQIYPATVDANGQFTATIPTPAAEGTYTATATDQAGNQGSAKADLDDQVAPQIADLEVDANADGSATVTGKTEPGASVEITTPDGQTYPASVDANGQFTATIPSPAAEGTYTATATDNAGNQGSATADLDDQVAPQIADLEVDANADGSATITGKTEPGASVEITTPDGQTYPASVDANGQFTATIPSPAAEGTYTATATDNAGNQGSATADLDDQLAPQIDDFKVLSNPDGSATITGKTESGAKVSITDPQGKDLDVTVYADGHFIAQVPATAAEGTYTATATDQAGNQSSASDDLIDATVPVIPTAEVNQKDGSTVFGKAQPGSEVTVYTSDAKQKLGTAVADANGAYSVQLQPALVDGEQVKVTAKDVGGESAAITAQAPDLFAPDAPTAKVNATGTAVEGVTEAFAIVTVYGGSKGTTPLGTATADANGHYQIALVPALVDGEQVKVTAKDAGGESLATPALAPDLYAPATPFATLDSRGAVVTGHAEAGSDITVYAADAKTILGTAIADLEGNFKVVLQPAVTDGQRILVTAKDDGGESAPQELIAPTVSIHAADNLVNANINFEYPVEEVRTNKLFNVFDLINIGSKVHTGYFSIGDQEVGEATISVHTGSLINLFDKAEMRLFVKNTDGSWKLIASNKDYGLLDFIGIFGEETAVRAKNLQSGEYKFEFVGGSAIGLATSVSANLSLKVFDTSVEPEVSHVEEAKGNVITDHDALYGQDAVPAGSIVNSINGQLINGTATVKGNYGTLTIHQDGSYSYKPKADVTAIGKAEVFSYSVVDPVSGKASSADLIIHIGTQSDLALNWNAAEPKDHASTVVATNNVDMIGFDASNTVSTGNSSSISYSWSIGFGGTKAGSTKITVADGTVENIKVDFGSSQLVSLLGNTTINVYDEKGKLVATSGASTVVDVIGLLPNGNSVTVTGLKAGTYTIQAVTNKGISLGGSVSAVISRSIIDLDSFTVKSAANAATKGNLLTDNDGFGVDTVASKYTDLYVSKDGGLTFTEVSSTGTTITAKYGEMVVKSDGSYTYTLKDTNLTSGAAEQFTYKLVAPNGDISAATLTIKAGVNFTGSVGNDEITSTAGNDQFSTKAGIDTVIYKVLDQADATGGNGHDTWNDFNASEGDKVNIKALLQGQNVNQSNIDQFVSVKSDGKGNTVISIDRDGTGSKFGDKVELLTLKNSDVTLQDLIDHNQLLY